MGVRGRRFLVFFLGSYGVIRYRLVDKLGVSDKCGRFLCLFWMSVVGWLYVGFLGRVYFGMLDFRVLYR